MTTDLENSLWIMGDGGQDHRSCLEIRRAAAPVQKEMGNVWANNKWGLRNHQFLESICGGNSERKTNGHFHWSTRQSPKGAIGLELAAAQAHVYALFPSPLVDILGRRLKKASHFRNCHDCILIGWILFAMTGNGIQQTLNQARDNIEEKKTTSTTNNKLTDKSR